VPLHRKTHHSRVLSKVASISSVAVSPHARRAQQSSFKQDTASGATALRDERHHPRERHHSRDISLPRTQAHSASFGAGEQVSVDTLLQSGYGAIDKELVPVATLETSARRESHHASYDFADIDPALLKATNSGMGGIVGTAMVLH
jgi:hypothetical protein